MTNNDYYNIKPIYHNNIKFTDEYQKEIRGQAEKLFQALFTKRNFLGFADESQLVKEIEYSLIYNMRFAYYMAESKSKHTTTDTDGYVVVAGFTARIKGD